MQNIGSTVVDVTPGDHFETPLEVHIVIDKAGSHKTKLIRD